MCEGPVPGAAEGPGDPEGGDVHPGRGGRLGPGLHVQVGDPVNTKAKVRGSIPRLGHPC